MANKPNSKKRIHLACACLCILAICAIQHFAAAQDDKQPSSSSNNVPEHPFRDWNGSWAGTFTVYHPDGRKKQTLNVTQTYTEVSATEQTAVFVNTDAQTGEVTRQTAKNTVENGKLLCEVQNEDGSVSTHNGRIEDGYLFWSHLSAGKTESFREWVDGGVYYIEGFGVYGDTAFMFVGKYNRVEPSETK